MIELTQVELLWLEKRIENRIRFGRAAEECWHGYARKLERWHAARRALETLWQRWPDDEFDALAMVHPIAEPELSGAVRPRYIRARTADGALVCATSIERNAAVEVCDQTPETIVQSAVTAVEDAVSQLGRPAGAALLFDCAARSAWFGSALAERELEAVAAAFGDPAPSLAGAFTRGEIGRLRGAKGDRNHSVVVAAFCTPD